MQAFIATSIEYTNASTKPHTSTDLLHTLP